MLAHTSISVFSFQHMCICTQTNAGICSFSPYSQTILADDGKHRQKKAYRIFECRAQPTSAPHALAQYVHFISQIWKIRERFLLYFFWADDGKQRRWEHEVFSIAVRWRRALRTVENRAFISLLHKDIKNPWTNFVHGFGADDQTWTGDLILTKDVLYHLSHISIFWRKRRDSNPRGLSPKRFSRPPRYDRFDTLP